MQNSRATRKREKLQRTVVRARQELRSDDYLPARLSLCSIFETEPTPVGIRYSTGTSTIRQRLDRLSMDR